AALNSLSAGGRGTTVGQGPAGTAGGGGGARRSSSGFGTGQRSLGGVGGVGGYGGGGLGGQGQFGQQGVQGGVGGMATPGAGGGFTDRLRSIIQRASTSGEIQVIG